ncbi:hypothetical protein H6P81_004061 [Aristolochia fimbriata]|uniref:Sn1-specific diacylglycerol lipase alpha n=1 Tax=Aristolochia fimbriata TaxID=158543 RepID=A0AAV7FF56_ARIFI|nr:hypothetical protein H6P81_004061 [Aristolochia fimbriata]
MATGTVATAAGAAMLLYFVLSRRLSGRVGDDDPDGELSKLNRSGRRRIARRPAQAPVTWFEFMASLSETIRFTYSETLGKWPIGDLAFGINYLMRRQGNLQVASVYAGPDCVQLKGPEFMADLIHHLRLLTFCMFFSKKPFPVFLESAGYSQDDVLLQEPKAGFLKPAFTIMRDQNMKCILLLIRGTHSIKDTLTAATGAVVPFHHLLLDEGGVSNLVLGYAHCGMVAAARWIAKLTIPCLLKAVEDYPDYQIKVVGHSLGGGTAAILTYILREREQFSSSTCVAFAPAACMTWDLAESGNHFITAIINGSDLVPTFSTASVDDLRSEVTSSSWVSDLRDQVERTRFLNVVFRSASAVGSRLPTISTAKARVAGAGALLRPVSNHTQGVMKRAQNVAQAVRTRSSFASWSCMGARRRSLSPLQNSEEDGPDTSLISRRNSNAMIMESVKIDTDGTFRQETMGEDEMNSADSVITASTSQEMTEGELWYELEKELHREEDESDAQREEEAQAAKEIMEEENVVIADAVESKQPTSSTSETQGFYPPGRIMHMVVLPPSETDSEEDGPGEEKVGIYETPRHLYSKIRLSRTMINDHYMPMYKKMMERLICEHEKDADAFDDI